MNNIDLFELRRGIFHILSGIAFVLIVMFVPHGELILFGVLVVGGFLSFICTQYNLPLITKCLCVFERGCNRNFPGRGVLFFFIGSLLALQLFSKETALAAILILTFADPVSHFVGSNFGKTSLFNKKKYIEGTIVGIFIGTLFASFFVSPILAFLGAGIAMFLEAVEIAMADKTIDDNLLIPLASGTIMHLIGLRFGL